MFAIFFLIFSFLTFHTCLVESCVKRNMNFVTVNLAGEIIQWKSVIWNWIRSCLRNIKLNVDRLSKVLYSNFMNDFFFFTLIKLLVIYYTVMSWWQKEMLYFVIFFFIFFFSLTSMSPIILKMNPSREICVQWNMNVVTVVSLCFILYI